MGFGICGHRFRRSPFTNKIFYIYRICFVNCAHVWFCMVSARITGVQMFRCKFSHAPWMWAPFSQSNKERTVLGAQHGRLQIILNAYLLVSSSSCLFMGVCLRHSLSVLPMLKQPSRLPLLSLLRSQDCRCVCCQATQTVFGFVLFSFLQATF